MLLLEQKFCLVTTMLTIMKVLIHSQRNNMVPQQSNLTFLEERSRAIHSIFQFGNRENAIGFY